MIFSRTARKLAAALGVCAMVFAQIAVAAHACAVLGGESPVSAMAMPMDADDAPCNEQDAAPNLCIHHCQAEQTVDHQPPAPAIPVAIIVGSLEPSNRLPVSFQSAQSYSQALLARVTAPPSAVRNCCFRI